LIIKFPFVTLNNISPLQNLELLLDSDTAVDMDSFVILNLRNIFYEPSCKNLRILFQEKYSFQGCVAERLLKKLLLLTTKAVPSSLILSSLMMEAMRWSETYGDRH
jgi:hypothetical protein